MSCHSNEMTPLPNTAVAVIFPHLCLRSNLGGIYPEKPHRATLMNDGNGTENFTQKVNSRCSKLLRSYSTSFNLSNTGDFFWSWFLQLNTQKEKKKTGFLVFTSSTNAKLGLVQTPLHSCAEPNWWIKYGKRAASESIWYGSLSLVRQKRQVRQSLSNFCRT